MAKKELDLKNLSQPAFGRLAVNSNGAETSRAGIGKAVKEKRVILNENGKIDSTHPTNKKYIQERKRDTRTVQNHSLRKAVAKNPAKIHKTKVEIIPNVAPSEILPDERSASLLEKAALKSLDKIELENEKLIEQITKLQIENAKNKKLSVPRDYMDSVFEKLNSVIVSTLMPIADQLGEQIAAIYEDDDPKKMIESETLIGNKISEGLERFTKASKMDY